ncbi:MAG: TetR/AcrR family transcriptional regulator [Acidimicrobiales bacterium]
MARTREQVIAAAVEQLVDVGFDRLSIDALAARSGVARSTIYRNWPDRSVLLAEAYLRIQGCGLEPVVASGDLAADLRRHGARLVARLTSDAWQQTVPSLISGAARNETIGALAAGFSADRRRELRQVFTAAEASGRLSYPERIDSAIERFVGPFFYRRMVARADLDDGFVTDQVEATLQQVGWVEGPPPHPTCWRAT